MNPNGFTDYTVIQRQQQAELRQQQFLAQQVRFGFPNQFQQPFPSQQQQQQQQPFYSNQQTKEAESLEESNFNPNWSSSSSEGRELNLQSQEKNNNNTPLQDLEMLRKLRDDILAGLYPQFNKSKPSESLKVRLEREKNEGKLKQNNLSIAHSRNTSINLPNSLPSSLPPSFDFTAIIIPPTPLDSTITFSIPTLENLTQTSSPIDSNLTPLPQAQIVEHKETRGERKDRESQELRDAKELLKVKLEKEVELEKEKKERDTELEMDMDLDDSIDEEQEEDDDDLIVSSVQSQPQVNLKEIEVIVIDDDDDDNDVNYTLSSNLSSSSFPISQSLLLSPSSLKRSRLPSRSISPYSQYSIVLPPTTLPPPPPSTSPPPLPEDDRWDSLIAQNNLLGKVNSPRKVNNGNYKSMEVNHSRSVSRDDRFFSFSNEKDLRRDSKRSLSPNANARYASSAMLSRQRSRSREASGSSRALSKEPFGSPPLNNNRYGSTSMTSSSNTTYTNDRKHNIEFRTSSTNDRVAFDDRYRSSSSPKQQFSDRRTSNGFVAEPRGPPPLSSSPLDSIRRVSPFGGNYNDRRDFKDNDSHRYDLKNSRSNDSNYNASSRSPLRSEHFGFVLEPSKTRSQSMYDERGPTNSNFSRSSYDDTRFAKPLQSLRSTSQSFLGRDNNNNDRRISVQASLNSGSKVNQNQISNNNNNNKNLDKRGYNTGLGYDDSVTDSNTFNSPPPYGNDSTTINEKQIRGTTTSLYNNKTRPGEGFSNQKNERLGGKFRQV